MQSIENTFINKQFWAKRTKFVFPACSLLDLQIICRECPTRQLGGNRKLEQCIIRDSALPLCFPVISSASRSANLSPELQTVTDEFAVDLAGCLRLGKPTVRCLRTVANESKINWAEAQSCFVLICCGVLYG
jgi:hypothetical protein